MSVASLNSDLHVGSLIIPKLARVQNNGVGGGDSGAGFYGRPQASALPRGIVVGGNTSDLYTTSWGRLLYYYPNLRIDSSY